MPSSRESSQPQSLECFLGQMVGSSPGAPGRPVFLGEGGPLLVSPLLMLLGHLVLSVGRTPTGPGGGMSLPAPPSVQGCGSGDAWPDAGRGLCDAPCPGTPPAWAPNRSTFLFPPFRVLLWVFLDRICSLSERSYFNSQYRIYQSLPVT